MRAPHRSREPALCDSVVIRIAMERFIAALSGGAGFR
jgi:hypothetical protein